MDTEQRLDELEARVAHQDHAILELSEEVFEQQKQLALVEGKCRHLIERLDSMAAAAGSPNPSDEVPPHY